MAGRVRFAPRGRVIVAEDDDEMRRIIVETLQRSGHEVLDVKDGVAVLLELAQNSRFRYDAVDLVVADVRMPLCSGLQVLETIHMACPGLPVVLLTAFGDAEMHARVTKLEGTLLDKPVSMEALRLVVASKIAERRSRRSS